jgi:hypothetical protein
MQVLSALTFVWQWFADRNKKQMEAHKAKSPVAEKSSDVAEKSSDVAEKSSDAAEASYCPG